MMLDSISSVYRYAFRQDVPFFQSPPLSLPKSARATAITTTEMMTMTAVRESMPLLQMMMRYTIPAIAATANRSVKIRRMMLSLYFWGRFSVFVCEKMQNEHK